MKILTVLTIATGALLSGCVAYDVPVNDGRSHSYSREGAPQTYYYRDGRQYYYSNDRDGDGVPNSRDRRPDNPNRY
ncbi:MAG: hypothetical protein ABI654_03305 [Betaproteobacteria bacterium]